MQDPSNMNDMQLGWNRALARLGYVRVPAEYRDLLEEEWQARGLDAEEVAKKIEEHQI